jgi:hypothetical protein
VGLSFGQAFCVSAEADQGRPSGRPGARQVRRVMRTNAGSREARSGMRESGPAGWAGGVAGRPRRAEPFRGRQALVPLAG